MSFQCQCAAAELAHSIYGKCPPCNLILLFTAVNQVRPSFCQEKKNKKQLTYFSDRNKSVSKLFQGYWKRKPQEMNYSGQPGREVTGDSEVGILNMWLFLYGKKMSLNLKHPHETCR